MNLRTQKRLLNLATVGCLLASAVVLTISFAAATPTNETDLNTKSRSGLANAASTQEREHASIISSDAHWKRKWRRPLYDPPPVKKEVVVVPPRPINYSLTGTAIESKNPQAFLKLSNGEIVLRQVGEQVTTDPLDGKISEITAKGCLLYTSPSPRDRG